MPKMNLSHFEAAVLFALQTVEGVTGACLTDAEAPRALAARRLLIALFLVPLAAPLAAITRVQISVPILVWFWWELVTAADPARSTARP